MASFSKIILIGNVGKAPEIKNGAYGRFVTCGLAVNDRKKAGTPEETQWYNLSFNGNLADIAGKYVRQGTPLYVEGRPSFRTYETRDGRLGFSVDVRVFEMQLLYRESDQISNYKSPGYASDYVAPAVSSYQPSGYSPVAETPGRPDGPINDLDDESIPF